MDRLACPKFFPLALVMTLAACAGRPVPGDGDETTTEDETTGDETDSDDTDDTSTSGDGDGDGDEETTTDDPPEEPLPEGFCEDACSVLAEGSCYMPETCVSHCEAQSDSWGVELGEAFAACMADNPLCFESVEGCMFNQINPPDTMFELRLRGDGFEAYEGLTVRAWTDQSAPPQLDGSQVISDGAFTFAWDEPFGVFDVGGPLLMYFIDVDDDGSCDPDIDFGRSGHALWNQEYFAPTFELLESPELGNANWVCGFVP